MHVFLWKLAPAQEKDWAKGYPKVYPILPFLLPVMLHLWQLAFLAFGEEFPGWNLKSSENPLCGAPPNKSPSSPTTAQRQNGDSHTSLPCSTENFSKSEKIKPVCCAQTVWSTLRKLRVVQRKKRRFSAVNDDALRSFRSRPALSMKLLANIGMTSWKCQATIGQLSYLFLKAHGVYKIKLSGNSFHSIPPVRWASLPGQRLWWSPSDGRYCTLKIVTSMVIL